MLDNPPANATVPHRQALGRKIGQGSDIKPMGLSGEREIVPIFIGMVGTQAYAFVKPHQTVYLRICAFYLL